MIEHIKNRKLKLTEIAALARDVYFKRFKLLAPACLAITHTQV